MNSNQRDLISKLQQASQAISNAATKGLANYMVAGSDLAKDFEVALDEYKREQLAIDRNKKIDEIMGLHIIPYRLKDRIEVEDYGNYYTEFETEKVEFDSLRYSGDKDFISETKWIYLYDDPNDTNSRLYQRPENISIVIEWINENITNNQQRLLDLLELMNKDVNIWIYVSR
jgi:hypothetical protein